MLDLNSYNVLLLHSQLVGITPMDLVAFDSACVKMTGPVIMSVVLAPAPLVGAAVDVISLAQLGSLGLNARTCACVKMGQDVITSQVSIKRHL